MSLSAEDRLSIHELISLHGHLTDDREHEKLHLLFTGDASYDISAYGLGVVEGLDALVDLFRQRPGTQPVGHHVTNVIVGTTGDAGDPGGSDDAGDDTATVRSKGLSVMADGTAGTVTYHDVVVRTEAGWRIARRKVVPARTD
jgi:SnoaL-like protein